MSSLRHHAAVSLALLATAATSANAGMFATEDTLADLTFAGGRIVYATPSLDEASLELDAENAVRLRVRDADPSGDAFAPRSGFSLRFRLGASLNGATPAAGEFMIFGSIPSVADSDTLELTSRTFAAMQADSNNESLDFLLEDKATTGKLARQYRSIGIYAGIGGLDDVEWIRQYDSSASIMNLVSDSAEPTPDAIVAPATPVPATAWLILGGLFGLHYWRRRVYC